jgi:hypothetical protein
MKNEKPLAFGAREGVVPVVAENGTRNLPARFFSDTPLGLPKWVASGSINTNHTSILVGLRHAATQVLLQSAVSAKNLKSCG